MNWKSSKLNVLGLEQKEKNILSLLKDPLNIQDMARKSPIPRTTIAYIVNKLIERGFIEKIKIGRRYKYYSIPEDQLKSLLEDVYIAKDNPLSNSLLIPLLSKKVTVYQGLKNVMRLQSDFLNSHRDDRIYAIQPTKSWMNLHAKADPEHVIHVNQIIKNNNLILEGIVEAGSYQRYKDFNKNHKAFVKLTASFKDRMADYVYAPSGFLTEQVEMWLIADSGVFIDWQEEFAIKIVDKHLVNFLLDMFKLTKMSGRKIDHNEAIREVLK